MRPARLFPVLALIWAACVSESTYKKEVQKADTLSAQNATYEKLNTQLQAEVKSDQVQIQNLQGELKVTIVNEILFPEGGWEIDKKGEATLDKIIPTLKALQGQKIEVMASGGGRAQRLAFRTNVDDEVALDEQHPLRVDHDSASGQAVPYVTVRDGLEARILRPVYYHLVELGEFAVSDGVEQFGVWSAGRFFPLGPVAD